MYYRIADEYISLYNYRGLFMGATLSPGEIFIILDKYCYVNEGRYVVLTASTLIRHVLASRVENASRCI